VAETYNSVSCSREGDIFHYRWAARRCLKLLDFNTPLDTVTIEGSNDDLAGELVIDVAEYSSDANDTKSVEYFQLKHSTAQLNKDFLLSHLKNTIEGFAKRFNALQNENHNYQSIKFSIITNRPISADFKENIRKLSEGKKADSRFKTIIEGYTELSNSELKKFCQSLKLVDGEGNYDAQKHEIHKELVTLSSAVIDKSIINNLVALVQEKVVTPENNKIVRENVLQIFGVTSEKELFPASPLFEKVEEYVHREQHEELRSAIIKAKTPVIISAGGGVGKSILCCQLAGDSSNGSLAIAYDCFGGGQYRKPSAKRHRLSDAFIQISNELAKKGLCEPLIPQIIDQDDRLMRTFLQRLKSAADALKQNNNAAILIIMFDAADNAEMAADEAGDTCFASQLLKEDVPDGCRIIFFSRPERVHLLKPKSSIIRLTLSPFSKKETLAHLKTQYPDAALADGNEFKRLTDGNPRVQANALNLGEDSIRNVLLSLGPLGTTVNDLIELQLEQAVIKIKEDLPDNFQDYVDAICTGLANLPPFIPVHILSAASGVTEEKVKSFVADLGRPLWLTDNAIQFRDEPTETWFRNMFRTTTDQISQYIAKLKPLATEFPYIAEVLPLLLLQAEQYDELIELALSDDLLPESPINARNIRVYRLQFAFKAALKQKKYADAAKLAFRAGEEVSGDTRQLNLLFNNIDLIAPLQSNERLQELSHRRLLRGGWEGSENIYSASLLSYVDEYKGEARAYLRSGEEWIKLYFEARDKLDEHEHHHQDGFTDQDIVEMANAHLNLFGVEDAVQFILRWNPPEVIFRVGSLFAKRLVDRADFSILESILELARDCPNFVIAISNELITVGKLPQKEVLSRCLNIIINTKTKLDIPQFSYMENSTIEAVLSFLEVCIIQQLCVKNIKKALIIYAAEEPTTHSITSEHNDGQRTVFMRFAMINAAISNDFNPEISSLLPKPWLKNEKDYENNQEIKKCTEVIGILLPWYMVRARMLSGENIALFKAHEEASKKSAGVSIHRYREYDPLPFEIAVLRFNNLILLGKPDEMEINHYLEGLSQEKPKFRLTDKVNELRVVYRINYLGQLRDKLEEFCYNIAKISSDDPDSNADWFIKIARAVLPVNAEDAAAYFDNAIESVSKFGDEAVERWEAIVSVAQRSAENQTQSAKMAYRFMRCAELIGENNEKYFNRNETVETCLSLSPESAFAILSRWKDRGIGWSDRLLPALAKKSVNLDLIPAGVGWSLSAFSWEYDLKEFAFLCIDKEGNKAKQQIIFDTLVRDLRITGVTGSIWQDIQKSAEKYDLYYSELHNVKALSKKKKEADERFYQRDDTEKEKEHNWTELLCGIELTRSEGLSEAIDIFDSSDVPRDFDCFWQELFKLITVSKAGKFLLAIADAESADFYDIQRALDNFPISWKSKPSVEKLWLKSISLIAKRFVFELTNSYKRDHFLDTIGQSEQTLIAIKEGILKGLSESHELVSASTFFGFAKTSVLLITPEQANSLLSYSLSRFEEHIGSDYADGEWSESLLPPSDISKAFTGYIWANLGSPKSSERWRSVHAVKRLYELGCQDEIDALLEWMQHGKVDAFGYKGYPFYLLHAKQYLLIALSRSVIDNPNLLKSHSEIFSTIAMDESHALIQKHSTDIAMAIETACPNTYQHQTIENLKNILSSPFPIKYSDRYKESFDTPWHINNELETNQEISFGIDFPPYWFEPLGRVFGISSQKIEDLARQVILKDWAIQLDDSYISEPRINLWRYDEDRGISHSHGSYPRIDNYSFYLSYHAMLCVASKLLHAMPVIHSNDWEEDEWGDWIRRHSLSRMDNKWLSDRRDPIPLERPPWINEEKSDSWRWEISQEDFLETLFTERNNKTWLNVAGHWNHYSNGHNEEFYVHTLLVPSGASQSLLNAIITNDDLRYHKLIDFMESEPDEIEKPFRLEKWVCRDDTEKYLDEYDPFAGNISYPPYKISKSAIDLCHLVSDSEYRNWSNFDSGKVSLTNQIWSEDRKISKYDDYISQGNRLQASFSFLLDLCVKTNSELAIEVQIQRRLTNSNYSRKTDDEIGYQLPYNKIYILSQDGKLRDTRKNYHIRKEVS